MITKKKKPAAPVLGDDFKVYVLKPERRLGVKYARQASEIIAGHGVKTSVVPETLTMVMTFPNFSTWKEIFNAINRDLKKIGLGFSKANGFAYQWVFYQDRETK